MILGLECKKMRRTGFALSFLCGGLLSGAVPILNMAVRPEKYLKMDAPPVEILMDANWQIMAMLNILLVVAGTCLMYHTEYADKGMQRMRTLPISESGLFFGKAVLTGAMCLVILMLEAAGTAFCLYHWFEMSAAAGTELLKNFGYALLLMLPAALISLLIASACQNMWISLGIGVVCIFTATMLPSQNFVLSLFPFALPFQTLTGTAENAASRFMIAAAAELFVLAIAEMLILKVRRALE